MHSVFLAPQSILWLGFVFLAQPGSGVPLDGPRPPATWTLRAEVEVDGQGIHLPQVVEVSPAMALPNLRLGEAPALGQASRLTQADLLKAVHAHAPELVPASWDGADEVRVRRRSRSLGEAGLKELLTETLQREYVGERGELELRLNRSWTPIQAPDDPLSARVVDLPTAGVTAYCIVRFELLAGTEVLGAWQVSLQAQVWKDVWVARSPLPQGKSLVEADLVRERRDVLTFREPLLDLARLEPGWETAQAVAAGVPLTSRQVRARPVVHRGQVVDAQLRDGPLLISMKVEVLENGAPGESVRVRNPKTRREFRGRVSDDRIIQVIL